MTPPKSRRFYDSLREQVRSAYESQRDAAHPSPADAAPPASPAEEPEAASTSLSKSEWTSESRSVSGSENHSEDQCEGRKVNQCINQKVNQSEHQFGEHYEEQSGHQSQDQYLNQSEDRKGHQSRDQSVAPFYSLGDDKAALCLSLGENPKRLLAAMIAIEKRWICLNHIPLYARNGTPMTYPSKRTALKRLTELGFILARKKKDFGTNKGLTYTLDDALCEMFQATFPGLVEEAGRALQEAHSGEHFQDLSGQHSGDPCEHHCEAHSEEQSRHQSESALQSRSECFPHTSSSLKTLTTMALGELPSLCETHPEYAFWREQHVGLRQISHWMEEFGIDALLMDDYLRWCAYDLGVAGRTDRNGVPIDNAQNWFYGLLKRTGAYPRPSGYKSCEERRTEQLEAARAEREALARRNEALLEQNALAELQDAFAAVMEEGEANATYRELRDQLPPFVRKQEGVGRGKIFEIGMWNAFKRLAGLAAIEDRPA